MSKEFTETTRVELQHEKKSINEIIKIVYSALEAKGYNPKNQIIGYILSGDPTYITNYNNCLLYTSPSPRDLSTSRMPSSA